MSTTTRTPIITREFRMAEVIDCEQCSNAVHFLCPFCRNEASVDRDKVTQVFSVRCNESGELYLVDQGNDEVERKPMNGEAPRVRVKAA